MPKYYSKDLRLAALSCVSRGERREEIIKFFGISLKTLSNWVRLERESKDLTPNKREGYDSAKSFKTLLLQAVSDYPDRTLDEFSEQLCKHRTTIFYHLKQLGVTRKKNEALRGAKKKDKLFCPRSIRLNPINWSG